MTLVKNEVQRRAFQAHSMVAGLDEAGRGPLAGPVVTALALLRSDTVLPEGLSDSKELSPKTLGSLEEQLRQLLPHFQISWVSAADIDRLNIYQATRQGMWNCIVNCQPSPAFVITDAMPLPMARMEVVSMPRADALEDCVMAASVLAKTARDRTMLELDSLYPEYGFSQHKGYPTKDHLQAIKKFGICREHRLSYRPVLQAALQRPEQLLEMIQGRTHNELHSLLQRASTLASRVQNDSNVTESLRLLTGALLC